MKIPRCYLLGSCGSDAVTRTAADTADYSWINVLARDLRTFNIECFGFFNQGETDTYQVRVEIDESGKRKCQTRKHWLARGELLVETAWLCWSPAARWATLLLSHPGRRSRVQTAEAIPGTAAASIPSLNGSELCKVAIMLSKEQLKLLIYAIRHQLSHCENINNVTDVQVLFLPSNFNNLITAPPTRGKCSTSPSNISLFNFLWTWTPERSRY